MKKRNQLDLLLNYFIQRIIMKALENGKEAHQVVLTMYTTNIWRQQFLDLATMS